MARTKATVHIQRTSIYPEERTVMLNESYVRQRKIPEGQPIFLRYGAAKAEIQVVPAKKYQGIRIGEELAGRLGLRQGASLCLRYKSSSRTLSLGPLIGVMVSRVNPQKEDRPFGNITSFCLELSRACDLYGASVYFFTPEGIRSSPESVEGWGYKDGWRKEVFPSPDVVYNRLTSRKYENKPSVQQFMKEVKSRFDTHIFNEKYLNKTEVFEALRGDSSLLSYLPESYLFKNYQMLKSMCAKHEDVFLKPITGSLGKGIIRIRRESGSYACHYSNVNGSVIRRYPSLSKLFTAVSGKMKRNKFQIQQGLNLLSVGGRPIDFRALVQRNEKGEWSITSIVGRIAGANHFVSNLARGGTLDSVGSVLGRSNLNSGSYAVVHRNLRKASLELAKGIETQIPGHFGELGIDLAVDTAGKVWLLEVNSKPSKDDNTSLKEVKIRPSVRQLVRYARFLANF